MPTIVPKSEFAIVVDSACDLPLEWCEEQQVQVVPFHTTLDGCDYPSLGTEGTSDFYVALATATAAPHVAPPTGLDYEHVFATLFEEGFETIVSIHASTALAGSFEAARTAARLMSATQKIELVDTKTFSVAEGLVLRDVVSARNSGVSAKEAAEHARAFAAETSLYFIPAPDRSFSSTGSVHRGIRGTLARLARAVTGQRQLIKTNKDGMLATVASHTDLSYLASDLVRHLSVCAHEAGPIMYAEVNAGMPRYLEYIDRPLDTNEFSSECVWVANASPATVSTIGIGAIGVGFAPRQVFWQSNDKDTQSVKNQGGSMGSASEKVDILLLGSGGREHALLTKLAESPRAGKLYVAPGNGGMWSIAERVDINPENGEEVASFARDNGIGLVVIGPEAPLVSGVADAVRATGIPVFGPNAAAARMEGSKQFAKEIMEKAGVPTASWRSFDDEDACAAYVREIGGPVVIKADGLAAGKGVVVAQSTEEALAGVHECFTAFGDAGKLVVVEELLRGPECSLLGLTDGQTLVPLAASQDHKRAYEGDRGPNTGGMGVYSPVPIVTPEELEQMVDIERRVVAQLAAEGIDYRGCLYGGFMLTEDGPKVLEFNARFGDPETQVVLPRMHADLVDVFLRCDNGTLNEADVSWDNDWAVSVVLASAGYPGAYEKGKVITGIDEANACEGVTVYHAGTALDAEGNIITAGGRVLDVTALAPTFEEARNRAYEACELINFEGKTCRHDIGLRALKGREAWEES